MTTEIKTYRVTWAIDLEGSSAEQVAALAARDYLQAGHTATVLEVAQPWGDAGLYAPAVSVDVGELPIARPDNALELLGQDLEEYGLNSDWERADVLAHIANNLAALLPAAAIKAAIDCAFADALICLAPSSSQDKADTLRRMMEGQP